MARGPWTPEERKQISERMKRAHAEGRAVSPMKDPAVVARMAANKRGKPGHKWTNEQKQAASKIKKRKITSGEIDISNWQQRGAEACTGIPLSKEHKQKISSRLRQAYAEGRHNRERSSEYRNRISEGLKRAYAEGRATPPTTRPEIAAKISKTKLENPRSPTKIERKQISRSLKDGYASGRIKSPDTPEGHYERLAEMKRGEPVPKERRKKISKAVKQRWDEGAFAVRNYKAATRFPGHPTPTEDLIAADLAKSGFVQQFILMTGKRKPSGHLSRYYYDFAHEGAKVIVEVDGESHSQRGQRERDAAKERLAAERGFTVLRFTNDEVVANPEEIVDRIRRHLATS